MVFKYLPTICMFVITAISISFSADVAALEQRSSDLQNKVMQATASFNDALAEIFDACGLKEQAEKMKATSQSLKQKPEATQSDSKKDKKKGKKEDKDGPDLKIAIESTNNAVDELDKIDLNSKMDESKAKEKLGSSILLLSAGAIIDVSAGADAAALVADGNNAIQELKSNPMAGMKAAGAVKEIVSSATFISQNVPPQAANVKKVVEKLVAYAKTKGIQIPSAEEINAKAASLGKE